MMNELSARGTEMIMGEGTRLWLNSVLFWCAISLECNAELRD